MTKDIVLVPTYWRYEYLQETLDRLLTCDGIDEKQIWVCQDRRTTDKPRFNEQIWHTQQLVGNLGQRIRYIDREPHTYQGPGFNIVDSYRKAYESDCKYVYTVLEDTAVAKDFFRWHEDAQSKAEVFCSVAAISESYSTVTSSDDPGFFTGRNMYSDIGVCHKRENLQDICTLPYSNPTLHGETDCQVRDLIDRNGYIVAGAYRPRAFHIGAVGMQRRVSDDRDRLSYMRPE